MIQIKLEVVEANPAFPLALSEWRETRWFPLSDVVGKYPYGREDLRFRLMAAGFDGPTLRLMDDRKKGPAS